MALNAADGTRRWTFGSGGAGVVSDGQLYIPSENRLFQLDLRSGRLERTWVDPFNRFASLAIIGEHLYVEGSDGYTILNRSTFEVAGKLNAEGDLVTDGSAIVDQ